MVEQAHVHGVYERIARHFSGTRHSAWPRVEQFLAAQAAGTVVADVGAGNGKHLRAAAVRSGRVALLCADRCAPLARDAMATARSLSGEDTTTSGTTTTTSDQGGGNIRWQCHGDVLVCDGLALPCRACCCDAVLCVAVVHHLSSVVRRVAAVRELARVLRPGGRLLLAVWALEQPRFAAAAAQGVQDVLVPWRYSEPGKKRKKDSTTVSKQPQQQPQQPQSGTTGGGGSDDGAVYQRFYHLFRRGELEQLVGQVPVLAIEECVLDHDNWFVSAIKTR
jgi:tRNA (uracil-5-)-methyltransferase TRM9